MPTLSGILEIAKRGLMVSQLGTNTAGNNIANVNTPGYTRQRVDLESSDVRDAILGTVGSGVDVQRIARQRDLYLDRQIRTANSDLGRFRVEAEELKSVEDLLQEPGGQGLGALLDEFWNAWYEVGNQPEDRSVRQLLVTKATALTDGFNRLAKGLSNARRQLNQRVDDMVKLLNDRFAELARLNGEIIKSQGQKGSANAALDRRDLILDEISQLVQVDVLYAESGTVNVYLEGQAVVQGVVAGELRAETTSVNGEQILQLKGVDGNNLRLRNGELKALVNVRDTILPGFQQTLDEIAETLVSAVNDLHVQGYTPDGRQGLPFFDSTKVQAKDIALDADILTDVSNVAVSKDGTPGSSDIATEIARLRGTGLLDDGATSLSARYSELLTEVGAKTETATTSLETQEMVVGLLEDTRESAQGVSLDEEMTNLITFQTAYGAAARVIGVVDEMMQTLLTMA
jgi:flagellar hook-associated protein 1 FlgK